MNIPCPVCDGGETCKCGNCFLSWLTTYPVVISSVLIFEIVLLVILVSRLWFWWGG